MGGTCARKALLRPCRKGNDVDHGDSNDGSRAVATRLNRRDLLRRGLALGLSVPAVAGLLAACGSSDKATATVKPANTAAAAGGSPTTAAATATKASASPSAAASASAAASPSTAAATATTASASPTTSGSGKIDGGDRTMGKTYDEPTTPGGTFIEASTLDLRSLSPVLWNDQPSILFGALVFESLIEADPNDLQPVGLLAESWEVSADATTWTVYLRDGVTFHDGSPLTADDVKFSADLFLNPDAGGSQTSNYVAKLDSVSVVDDLTVQFVGKQTNPDFLLDIVAPTAVVRKALWENIDPKNIATDPGSTGQDASRVVGTGPFKFKEWVTGQQATAVRFDDYWDGKPYLDEYVFKIVPDETAAIQQLNTGEVDYFVGVPGAQVKDVNADQITVATYKQLSFTFYGYQLDETKSTKFLDPNVRKALLYALDRQSFVDNIYFGYAEVAVGTIPPLSWAYNPDGIKEKYEFNVDKANQLLDDAGWVKGSDGIRAKDGQQLKFDMWTANSIQTFVSLLQAYQESWKAIGVDMTPQTEPFQEFVNRITQTFDYEIMLIGFGWNIPPDQSPMWACSSYGSGFNVVKYCNPKVDDLLNQALVETDQQKRIQLYTDFQNALLDDLPMAVTEFGLGIDGVSKKAHNVFPSYANTRFNLEKWWVEK
jgi:peptide/nickel transport system substrate-binding protein